jgi:hypothetical protein
LRIALSVPRESTPADWQRSTLAGVYAVLAFYFLVIKPDGPWLASTAFLAIASGAAWYLGVRGEPLFESRPRISRAIQWLTGLPPLYLALPLPVMASWFAGQLSIQIDPEPDYWDAFWLWLVAMGVFLALLLPWRRVTAARDYAALFRNVPWLEVGGVAFLTLVAFGARAVDLVDEPSPFSGDEGNFGIQAIEVLDGVRRNMFATGAPFGQPAMYYWLVAGFYKVLGVGVLATRLPSVLFGITMVPLLYLLLREQFDRRIAFIGAAFLAVYHFHIHFSRVGLNNMSAAWIAVACLYFAARANRTQSALAFGLAGALAGLSFYSFVAARAVPLVLALYFGWVILFNWRFLRDNIGNFLVLVVGFVVVAAPQAIYFNHVPDDWYAGHRWANIFGNNWLEAAEAQRNESAITILVGQFKDAFEVLVREAEVYHHYNAETPLIDVFSRWFFIIGAVIALVNIRQPRYFMQLALLLVTLVLGAALVTPPPSAARLVTAAPAIAAIVAIGLVGTGDMLVRWRPQYARFMPYVAVAAVLFFTFLNVRFYFGDYLPNDRYVVAPDDPQGKNDYTYAMGRYVESLDEGFVAYMFIEPLTYTGDPTIAFFARDHQLVGVPPNATKVFETEGNQRDATFVFIPERQNEAAPFRDACPGGEWKEFVETYDRRTLFFAYELPGGRQCLAENDLETPVPPPGQATPPVTDLPGNPASRDAQRSSDLELVAAALEAYYQENGEYPSTGGLTQTICVYEDSDAGCALTPYLSPLPIDPTGDAAAAGYFYISDGQRFSLLAIKEEDPVPPGPDCHFYATSNLRDKPVGICVSGQH